MENEYLFLQNACALISEIVEQPFSPELVNLMDEKELPNESWECGVYYVQYFMEYLNEFAGTKLSQVDIIEMLSTICSAVDESWNHVNNSNKEVYEAYRDGFLHAVDLDIILPEMFGIELLPYKVVIKTN